MSEPQVAALLDAYVLAVAEGDRAALEVLLDDDFQFVSAHARIVGREQRLATLVSGAVTLTRLEFGESDIRELPHTAIVRVSFTAEFKSRAGSVRVDRGVSTFVLVRRVVGWRIYHQHNSHVDSIS